VLKSAGACAAAGVATTLPRAAMAMMAALVKLFIAALPHVFDLVEDQSTGYRLTTFLFSLLGSVKHRKIFPMLLKTLPSQWANFSTFFHAVIISHGS